MPSSSDIKLLFRYFGAAAHMRELYRNEVNLSWLNNADGTAKQTDWTFIFNTVPGLYLTYWYSNLYLTIEAWNDLGFSDAGVDRLLESQYVNRLRRFRNATFHCHKDFENPKHTAFFENDEERTEAWLNQLQYEFQRFFRENRFPLPPNLTAAIEIGTHVEVARAVKAALGRRSAAR
jgi:phytoene dehydrogenase-like protein